MTWDRRTSRRLPRRAAHNERPAGATGSRGLKRSAADDSRRGQTHRGESAMSASGAAAGPEPSTPTGSLESGSVEPVAERPYMPGYGIVGPDEGSGLLPWSWAVER